MIDEPESKKTKKAVIVRTSSEDITELNVSSSSQESLEVSSTTESSFSANNIAHLSFESNAGSDGETITTESTGSLENNTFTGRKKYTKHIWTVDKVCNSLEEATAYLNEKNFARYKVDTNLTKGVKIHFRCKSIPKNQKVWCSRKFEISCPNDSTDFIVSHNNVEHDHEKIGTSKRMSGNMINFLISLFEKKTTDYDSIILHIAAARKENKDFGNENDPTKTQVSYQLRKFRGSEAKVMVSVGDLMEWCENNSQLPENVNDAFVISSSCSKLNEERHFQFVVSTPYLLNYFKLLDKICIDSTYKLNWHGFPLTILGTVDREKKFHPIAYACTTNETTEDYAFIFDSVKAAMKKYFDCEFQPSTIIADGADAIRNAFYKSFKSAKLDVMCFAHVLRNITKRPFQSQNNKNLIIDDIKNIQLASDKQTFKMMTKKFCEKWSELENEFVTYFKKQWLGKHCNWYEGAAIYTPSTNNAQEGYNGAIKKKITMRRRLPIKEFLGSMKKMPSERSHELHDGVRKFALEPAITKKLMQKAILFEETCKAFKAKKSADDSEGVSTYVVPSSKCSEENAKMSYYKEILSRNWKSFDEFIQYGFQLFWIIRIKKTGDWKIESSCSCPVFGKEYICKHILALAYREKLVEFPIIANPTLLTRKTIKKGRPKNTTKALVID